ncbi:MAG: PAS domain S-box protein [Deltaproteobacteria bacterium]|nr:PAS domain S-box protein [Deltaproteobacteria bacterium]
MTLFRKIRILFYKAVKLRIWFASVTVVILFLLLALTVNSAREKDIVNIFSRQQLINVQNTSKRMTDVFSQIGKNADLFSRLYPSLKMNAEEMDSYYKMLSSGWENTFDTIVLFDANGKVVNVYPKNVLPAINLSDHFNALRKSQKQYLNLAKREPSPTGSKQKTDRYLVLGYPLKGQNAEFAGALLISFSLSAVLDKYRQQTASDELGELWLMDEKQKIVIHSDSAFIGKDIQELLTDIGEKGIDFSSDNGGYFESVVRLNDQKQQKSIISYYSFKAGDKKWTMLVVAPYSRVISPLRKTFFYTLFSSLLLIIVVIITSMSFAYREGKKLRIREERKRLIERQDWQEKLLREKKTIEGIIEGSPIPSFVIDNEHKVILWNRACTGLTGASAEEVLGTDNHSKPFYSVKRPMIADLIVDNDIEGLSKYYDTKKVKKSDKVIGAYEATDYFENLRGQSRYMYFLASPIYDEDGRIIAAIETLQDVSREKEMTKNLSEYAETLQNELIENIELRRQIEGVYNYLKTIVNSLPDKIYEIDENGIINFMSRGLKKKDDLSRELRNKHFLDFVEPGYEDFVSAKWEEAKKGIYRPYEIEATGKDGRRHNLLITTSPVLGTNHYILVQRDITEFKNLEKKLYDSQKLAALGQLSAGIAHEIRNPLSSIKMSLQILEKRMSPEGNDLKRFKIAEKEVDHLETLVNDILAFAKPVEPKKIPVDLSKVLEQAIDLAEKGITDKKIDVRTEFADVPYVTVDPAMMADSFLNVVRNAVEAVEENGRIEVSLRYFDDTRHSVAVEIKDNGGGISEEDLPHIFNPFFTRKNYGTGLGLSLVKKIIDIHQGTIDIFSKKNEGTTVLIVLPLGTEGVGSPVKNN